MTPEEKLKNVIFRIIDANSLTGASLEETEEIFNAIQQAKSEWCREQRENCSKIINGIDFTEDFKKNLEYEIFNAPKPK
jgi:hypothetical protein